MTAGYSGTPLPKKLGIKPGQRVRLINAPPDYERTLGALPEGVDVEWEGAAQEGSAAAVQESAVQSASPFIQIFVTERSAFEERLPELRDQLAKDGMLWVSWPKKASGVPTDLNENAIRELALEAGLVDVKVCAVDEVWSGLKLVFRLRDR